jgi:hypothetical protein
LTRGHEQQKQHRQIRGEGREKEIGSQRAGALPSYGMFDVKQKSNTVKRAKKHIKVAEETEDQNECEKASKKDL